MSKCCGAGMFTEIDGYNISYKISGDGDKNVVILQGWGTDMSVYDSVAAALAPEYRVIQFDLPGFGKSDEPKEPWNVDRYADFFCRFMEKLEIGKADLIGHSYGGRIIIKLLSGRELPFGTDRVVLMDSAGVLPERTLMQKIRIRQYKILKKLFYARLFNFLFPDIAEDWKMRQGSEDYRKASPIMRQCLVLAVNEDLSHLLPEIKQETLLIWGDKDTATPMRDAKIMEERIPNAGLVVLEGCGHYAFLEQPVKFRSVLRAFFDL